MMRFKEIGVLVLVLTLASALLLADAVSPTLLFIGVITPTLVYSRYRQPSNDVKNMREFLKSAFDGKVQDFSFNEITKPGDNFNSRFRGLQVKLLKNNGTKEVIM